MRESCRSKLPKHGSSRDKPLKKNIEDRLAPHERPTAQQLAAASAGGAQNAWACPRCGCTGPHRVESTYDTKEGRARRRICRNCGEGLIKTVEVAKPNGYKVIAVPDDETERAAA